MAQGEGFKHITVTSADEGDVVIHAGTAREEEPTAAPEPSPEPPTAQEPAQTQSVPSPTPAAAPKATRAKAKKKREPYRETTLEDLQHEPMPTMQKIVIIAAVVCIIGAIVYCAFFLR